MNSNTKRGQSGVDMVMTYGWVFLLGVGAVILLSQMGTFTSQSCDKVKFGFSQIMPVDWAVYIDSNRMVSRIENLAGGTVNVTGMNMTLGDVTCTSTDTIVMDPGQAAIVVLNCPNSPSLEDKFVKGSCYMADVTINYLDASSGATSVSKGTIRGPMEEGNVTTTMSAPLPDLAITDIYVDDGLGNKIHPTTAGQPNPSGVIKYTISNIGDNAAGASHSSITVTGSATSLIATPVPALGQGSSSDEGTGKSFNPCPNPGDWFTVTVCANAQGEVNEINTANNCLSVNWWCQGADMPPIVQLLSPDDGSTP